MIFISAKCTYGEDYEDELSDYDFSDIQEIINEENEFDFSDALKTVLKGDFENGLTGVFEILSKAVFCELDSEKQILVKIIIVGLIAALLSNVICGFANGKITETGFYIVMLTMLTLLLAGYRVTAELVTKTMNRLLELMEAITPVYVLSIGFSTGQNTASGFYQVVIILISIIEKIMLGVIIPLIYGFMVTGIINNFTDGKMFNRALELMKTIIEWSLKTMLTFVIGINIVRTLINPIVDSIKLGSLWKIMQSLPGVTGALGSVSSIFIASGTLIKNGIGVTSGIAILVVTLIPIIKTGLISISFKGVGAILEPVSDKRIVNCINGMHESLVLLFKSLIYATLFFVLSIAIICAA